MQQSFDGEHALLMLPHLVCQLKPVGQPDWSGNCLAAWE